VLLALRQRKSDVATEDIGACAGVARPESTITGSETLTGSEIGSDIGTLRRIFWDVTIAPPPKWVKRKVVRPGDRAKSGYIQSL
jgi:hypothetical protein